MAGRKEYLFKNWQPISLKSRRKIQNDQKAIKSTFNRNYVAILSIPQSSYYKGLSHFYLYVHRKISSQCLASNQRNIHCVTAQKRVVH